MANMPIRRNKIMTNNKTNNNQTRVVCPVCGTSFALPEHQSIGCGVAIGKDSNLGTIYLTPEDKRLDALKAAGIDVSNFMKAADLLHNYKEEDEFNFDTKEIDEVIGTDYVYNRYTSPRWLVAQMFHMLNSKDGYDKCLSAKGNRYQYNFLKEEIHRLAKMERQNDEYFSSRSKFFSPEIIAEIMQDYISDLEDYIESLDIHKYEGNPYKRIRGYKYSDDGKGDVLVKDIEKKVMTPIRHAIQKMGKCNSYSELERVYVNFLDNLYIKLDAPMSKAFKDVYKGMGAYYTMDNLIKFHGCKVDGKSTVDSLKEIKAKQREYIGEYWRLFALMKKVIKDNNYKPQWN